LVTSGKGFLLVTLLNADSPTVNLPKFYSLYKCEQMLVCTYHEYVIVTEMVKPNQVLSGYISHLGTNAFTEFLEIIIGYARKKACYYYQKLGIALLDGHYVIRFQRCCEVPSAGTMQFKLTKFGQVLTTPIEIPQKATITKLTK
jgi:hypothetical protein